MKVQGRVWKANGRARRAWKDVRVRSTGEPRPLEGVPSEVMDMFREAQQNILDLNQSRLLALEELQHARSRIADLEERVMEAEAAAAEAVALAEARSAAAAAAAAEERSAKAQRAYHETTASMEEGSSARNAVTLVYKTGWNKAYVHFRTQGGEWTTLPGRLMDEHEPGYKRVVFDGTSVEFVFNDGKGNWDKRVDGRNYSLEGRGTYMVSDGNVSKIDSWSE